MSQQKPFPPEKAAAKPSVQRRRPWPAILMALILAGAAVWFWAGKDPARRAAVPSTAPTSREVSEPRKSPIEVNATASPGLTPSLPPLLPGGQAPGQTGEQTPGGEPSTGAPAPAAPATGEAEGRTTRGLVVNEPQTPKDPGLAGRKDDAVVRPVFISDLARWMVESYIPASGRNGRSSTGVNIQTANARYGVGMKGLAWIGDDLPAGRAAALRHVYTPGMLDALYRMYIDRFMQAVAEFAAEPRKNGKTLEPEQVGDMYRLYAGRLRALSGAMQGVAALEDLRPRIGHIQNASQKAMAANMRYMEEVFKFDQAREGNDQVLIAKTRASMDAAADAYHHAAQERDQLRDALIAAIRNHPGARSIGDDNLFYVAMWINRRLQQSSQAREASLQGASLFLDLAQRFERIAGARQ